jgi:trans-aconitate 2-methyltransferase
MTWNPELYNQFKAERSQPFYDLVNLIQPRPNLKVIDLGCGTGELTSTLVSVLPGCTILGIDTSKEMLAKAENFSNSQVHFEFGSQENLEGPWDLIISNAALQWSDDHSILFPEIFEHLNEKGQLVIQMPSNHNSRFHQVIREVSQLEPFGTRLGGYTRTSPVLTIEEYADLFYHLNARDLLVFEKIYPHVLSNVDQVIQWLSGTALLPYLDRLGDLKQLFLESIRSSLHQSNPQEPLFYPFKRLFISAKKY